GWVLPVFALLLHLAVHHRSTRAAIAGGLVLAATTYTAYYYVVYLALFAVTYVLATPRWIAVSWPRRIATIGVRLAGAALAALALSAGALALWIAQTGGATYQLGRIAVSLRQPQNPLSLMWLALIGAVLCARRISVVIDREASALRPAMTAAGWIVLVFGIVCAPIIVEAAHLVRRGEYVTPVYFWRSAPRGVDLSGPLVGHPRHPLTKSVSQRAYGAMHTDYIETVGWIGVVPVLLLLRRRTAPGGPDPRVWWIV